MPHSSFIRVGLLEDFLTPSTLRFVLSFRSYVDPSLYTSILLFRFPGIPKSLQESEEDAKPQFFAMESECPHLGASLEQADIEDLGDSKIIVCPWHSYGFDLDTGESDTAGMKACTFRIEIREDAVWVEPPGDERDDWRLLGVRPVSERFAEADEPIPSTSSLDPEHPLTTSLPTTLVSFCRLILLTPSPTPKIALVRQLVSLFRSGQLTSISSPDDLPLPLTPPREKNIQVVSGYNVGKRGKGGTVANRAKLLHALSWIELWAIDLSIDIVGRFAGWKVGSEDGKKGKKLPIPFFMDFLKVAEDEAKHFSILRERMLQMGFSFGDFTVHNGLWESATTTMHDLFSRIAIVHLVHEARGLDVNPLQIARCRAAGDLESAEVMSIIHNDEITHVACGHRHFQYLCANASPPLDPVEKFRREVKMNFHGKLKGPFNNDDRGKAGLTGDWYENLEGLKTNAFAPLPDGELDKGVEGLKV